MKNSLVLKIVFMAVAMANAILRVREANAGAGMYARERWRKKR